MNSPVVHVTPHYPPFLGGMEKVVESLAAHQKMQGLEVSVLTSSDGPSKTGDTCTADYVQRLASWEIAHTTIMPFLPRELWRLRRDSVIHLHISQAFVPEAVYAARLLRRIPYVAHLHIDQGPSGWAGFLLRVYKPLMLKRVLKSAAAVVVFTEGQKAAIAAHYSLDPGRIAIVPNGVDESFFYTDERTLHDRPRLLFVGRLSIQKNLSLFLRALEGISEKFDTILVGDGELENEHKRTVHGLGLRNVHFHGRADGAELRQLYQDADVFVLPSEREGMPLVLLEALAMGLPVVATDIPGNRDVILHGRNGILVPLGEPAQMRRALEDVTGDPVKYQHMSDASRRLAVKYSWKLVSAEFERIYSQASRS